MILEPIFIVDWTALTLFGGGGQNSDMKKRNFADLVNLKCEEWNHNSIN